MVFRLDYMISDIIFPQTGCIDNVNYDRKWHFDPYVQTNPYQKTKGTLPLDKQRVNDGTCYVKPASLFLSKDLKRTFERHERLSAAEI